MESSDFSSDKTLTLGDCGFVASFVWIDQLSKAFNIEIKWPETVLSYRMHIEQFMAVKDELNDYIPKASAWVIDVNAA